MDIIFRFTVVPWVILGNTDKLKDFKRLLNEIDANLECTTKNAMDMWLCNSCKQIWLCVLTYIYFFQSCDLFPFVSSGKRQSEHL